MTTNKRRQEFIKNIRKKIDLVYENDIQEGQKQKISKPKKLQSDADLMVELERKFDELFGSLDDDDDNK